MKKRRYRRLFAVLTACNVSTALAMPLQELTEDYQDFNTKLVEESRPKDIGSDAFSEWFFTYLEEETLWDWFYGVMEDDTNEDYSALYSWYEKNQEQIAKQNSDIGTAHMNAALVLALSGYRDKANEYINVARAYLNNSGEKIQQFTSKVNKINTEKQSMLTNKQLYDRANSAYKSGNYTQAVDYLSKIINSNTLDKQLLHDAYNLRYIIKNYNLNDEKGAASDYAKLLELEK